MTPAAAVEAIDANRRSPQPRYPFSRTRLYPMTYVMVSNTIVAPVKPRNWTPPGFKVKLIRVAMSPTIKVAPGFLNHQIVKDSAATPSISHRIGRWVRFQNAGPTWSL